MIKPPTFTVREVPTLEEWLYGDDLPLDGSILYGGHYIGRGKIPSISNDEAKLPATTLRRDDPATESHNNINFEKLTRTQYNAHITYNSHVFYIGRTPDVDQLLPKPPTVSVRS